MNFNFFASQVSTSPVDGVWTVSFAAPTEDAYLQIQRDVEHVLEGQELKQHRMQFGSQLAGGQGCLEKVQILRDAVRFQLTVKGAERIGVSEIVVSFSVSKAELASISTALAHIVEHGRVEVL